MDDGGAYRGRGRGRGQGRGGRFGRGGRGEGRGDRRARPDPQPCPITVDEQGRLKIKITCLIMRDFAGAVIGRGGEHVTDIRKESGALIHVCKPDMSTGIQGVDIFGTLQQVGSAQGKLSDILEQNASEWCAEKSWGARIKLMLLPDMASIVIGKKGNTVQRIIKESGASVRVNNEAEDATNLQSCQIYGSNNEATAAFVLLIDALADYDAQNSRSLPRLREIWEQRRAAEQYPPPDAAYSGAGGPAPTRERYGGFGMESRYEPYPPRTAAGSYSMGGGPSNDEVPSQSPMVVMPGSVQVPSIPGGMPTVLIQHADGSLVQAQVVTQAGGQYSVQPATQAQGAVQHLKTQFGAGQPLSTATNAASLQQNQTAVPGTMGQQVVIQTPGGVVYATPGQSGAHGQGNLADPNAQHSIQAVQGYVSSVGASGPTAAPIASSQMIQAAPAAANSAVTGAASAYHVTPNSNIQGSGAVASTPQAADPVVYAKLAGYGQGVSKAPNAQYSVTAAAPQGQVYTQPQGAVGVQSLSYGQNLYGGSGAGSQYSATATTQYAGAK